MKSYFSYPFHPSSLFSLLNNSVNFVLFLTTLLGSRPSEEHPHLRLLLVLASSLGIAFWGSQACPAITSLYLRKCKKTCVCKQSRVVQKYDFKSAESVCDLSSRILTQDVERIKKGQTRTHTHVHTCTHTHTYIHKK